MQTRGVTLSVKNLFGIAPTSIYGDNYDGAGNPSVDETCLSPRGDSFHRGERMPPKGVPQGDQCRIAAHLELSRSAHNGGSIWHPTSRSLPHRRRDDQSRRRRTMD